MTLTLSEAIDHCEEVAKEQEWQAYKSASRTDDERMSCLECAKDHSQLAEWLKELELYRETLIGRPCEVCKFHETGSCSRWNCVFEEVNADEDSD